MATLYQFTNNRQFCLNISYGGGVALIYIEYSCSCLYLKQTSLHVFLSKKTTKDCMNYATTFTERLCYRSFLLPCYLHWQESVLYPRFLLLSFVIIHREPMASSELQLPYSIWTSPESVHFKIEAHINSFAMKTRIHRLCKKEKTGHERNNESNLIKVWNCWSNQKQKKNYISLFLYAFKILFLKNCLWYFIRIK